MKRKTIQSIFNDALKKNLDIADQLKKAFELASDTNQTDYEYIFNFEEYSWNSSDTFRVDAVVDAIERFYTSYDQWVTKENYVLWFLSFDEYSEIPEDVCKNITRGVLWLLFTGKFKVTKNHLKYIGLKIYNQRLYEIEEKVSIVPPHVYKYLNVLHFAFTRSYRNARQHSQ